MAASDPAGCPACGTGKQDLKVLGDMLVYILGLYWDYIEGSGFRVQAELYPGHSPRNPLVWSLSYKKSCISRLHKHGVSTVLVTHTPRS